MEFEISRHDSNHLEAHSQKVPNLIQCSDNNKKVCHLRNEEHSRTLKVIPNNFCRRCKSKENHEHILALSNRRITAVDS